MADDGRCRVKNAVVTGGGSGIGQAVANRLRADGYHVATLDLNPVRREVRATPPTSPTAPRSTRRWTPSARNWARSPSW